MPIRLIAIDIDGTLVDTRSQVPERNKRALAEAAGQGVEIVIATGRRYDFAKPILDTLTCPVTVIASNGALVRTADGTTPLRRLLPVAVAREVLDVTRAWRDNAALAFDRPREQQVIFERIDRTHPARRAYAEHNAPFIAEMAPLEAALVEAPLQVMFNGPVVAMRALVACLTSSTMANRISLAATEYPARDFALVDVLTAGCTKGSMLTDWMAHRGIVREQVMALGDNLNDLEMLEAAGLPVVMANAVPELRGRGWHETARHDECGVAQAVERWILGSSQ
jgi:Cof subfamily protein (haloacid dehalogenase superfamily)